MTGLTDVRDRTQDGGKTYRLNDDRTTLHTAVVSGRG